MTDLAADSGPTNPAGGGRIYTIPPGLPFLSTLAEAFVSGRLVAGFDPASDPLMLGEALIYLPTRRAARALGVELTAAMQRLTGREATLLPRIRTIGDLDEEEIIVAIDGDLPPGLGRPVDDATRMLALAALTRRWSEALSPESRSLLDGEPLALPATASDAIRLAGELMRFMDQVETEEADWQAIREVAPEDHARWWQLTLEFLSIVMARWSEHLAAHGAVNPAVFRRRLIDFRANELRRKPPKGPVIAAGSTGSIPATARLLKTIAGLPNGAVVLPGLDSDLSLETHRRFVREAEFSGENALSTHPQFGLARLLAGLQTPPGSVSVLGSRVSAKLAIREAVVNTALMPAAESGNWPKIRAKFDETALAEAFAGVSLIEAPSEQLEALAIALTLRETLETPGKRAALVTPDRGLARRVSAELERFAIQIDDSAGSALSLSQPAIFLRLLLAAVFAGDDPVALATLVKHPFLDPHDEPAKARRGELLELALLRDAIKLPPIDRLGEAVHRRRRQLTETPHAPAVLRQLTEADWVELGDYAAFISAAIAPLLALNVAGKGFTLPDGLSALMATADRLSGAAEGEAGALSAASGGAELKALLDLHCEVDGAPFSIRPSDFISVFDALLAGKRLREAARTHPRLHIYGPLEARLQSADLFILGGLNEGVWPRAARNDPFLNRPMKSLLDLPLPERRIGLAAHDFAQLSGADELVYSRAKRLEGAPSIASRWLQRLSAFLGEGQASALRQRGSERLMLARAIDAPRHPIRERLAPNPTPPVALRPKTLSVTEIETLIRDPYAIYAKHVLELRPLPPLRRLADPALRGNLYHAILAAFTGKWKGPIDAKASERLDRIADRLFAEFDLPAEIAALWRPRFDAAAAAFLAWEGERRAAIAESHSEIAGKLSIGDNGFILRGRADRLDRMQNGTVTVVDYKTGQPPSGRQARSLSPQLALEGAMVQRGGFAPLGKAALEDLLYVRIAEGDNFGAVSITRERGREVAPASAIAEAAYNNLCALIAGYDDPAQGYRSRYAPLLEREMGGDYDHLARVREWSLGDEDAAS